MSDNAFPRKGATGYYDTHAGVTVRAIVRTMHRDGTLTVEPMFFVRDGKDSGVWIGGRVRLLPRDFRQAAAG